jgi:hypothetical protein
MVIQSRKLSGPLGPAPENTALGSAKEPWVVGILGEGPTAVPQVATQLRAADRFGGWKARWAIGRDDYAVLPGLYAVGSPDRDAPVLATANYKMTFDSLRKELRGIDAWILVLDTKGINVWCAAGKGTFGTKELVRRIRAVGLDRKVAHRTIVLPQLGAVGVAAHAVVQATGFAVAYGPVRAADLPAWLAAGQVATPAMRRVRFDVRDRLALAPAELVFTFKPALIALGVLFLLNASGLGAYGLVDLYALAGTLVVGCVLVPVLLPFLPGRAFSLKGAGLGLLWAVGVCLLNGWPQAPTLAWPKALAYLLLLPALSSFLAMNFTGSSTYTSPSGVNREMRRAIPAQFVAALAGVLLLLGSGILALFD